MPVIQRDCICRRPEIKQIRLSHKTGLPRIKQDLGMSQPNPPHPNKLPKAPNRKHDETTEDKKARKQAVKEAQVFSISSHTMDKSEEYGHGRQFSPKPKQTLSGLVS